MRSVRFIAPAGRLLAASAAALALAVGIGAYAPAASAGVPGCAWQPLTLLNGWQSAQNAYGTGDPSFCATSDGMVYLSGSLVAPNGASSEEFAVLPSYAAPAHYDYLSVYTMNGTVGVLRIDPNGALRAYDGKATQFTSLAGVSFPAASVSEQGLMPLMNGWQSAQNPYLTGDPAYFVSGGIVHLSGSVLNPNGSPAFGSTGWTFAVLPSQAKPTDCFNMNVYIYGGGTSYFWIDQNGGGITGASAAFTSLAGVSYPAAPVTWQPLTLLNGGNADGNCDPPSYYISGGVVYLTGFLEFASGFNGEFAVLPAGARPAHTLYLDVNGDGQGGANYLTLRIDPSGAMYFLNGGGTPPVQFDSLSGLSYHTGS